MLSKQNKPTPIQVAMISLDFKSPQAHDLQGQVDIKLIMRRHIGFLKSTFGTNKFHKHAEPNKRNASFFTKVHSKLGSYLSRKLRLCYKSVPAERGGRPSIGPPPEVLGEALCRKGCKWCHPLS